MSAGSYLVISEKVLDVVPFYTSISDTLTWKKSTIRSWLNSYDGSDSFIDAAFTEDEKNKIELCVVHTIYQDYTPGIEVTTDDKIFIFSIDDVRDYLGYDPEDGEKNKENSQAEATPYALKKGVYTNLSGSAVVATGICPDTHCYADWWLRSPGHYSYLRVIVKWEGGVVKDGYISVDEGVGVRPAMWLGRSLGI